MAFDVVEKAPGTVAIFTIEWAPDIRPGETLDSCAWHSIEEGVVRVSDQLDGSVAQITISGGTLGQSYLATCRATYSSGRTEDWTIRILIKP